MPVKRGLKFEEVKRNTRARASGDVPVPIKTNTSPTQLGAYPRSSPINGSPTNQEDDDTKENYGLEKIQAVMDQCTNDPSTKPDLSYIALIGLAIQRSAKQQCPLSDIYDWISTNFPYFDPEDRSWRNSVRHNLSLNECFIKAVKIDGSKSANWIIHPANVDDFAEGDFRRRRARRKVRQAESKKSEENEEMTVVEDVFVPMTVTSGSADELIAMFGKEAILGDPKKIAALQNHQQYISANQCQNEVACTNMYNGVENVTVIKGNQVDEIVTGMQTRIPRNDQLQPEYVEMSVQHLSELQNQNNIQPHLTVDQSVLESGLAILSEALCMGGQEEMEMESDDVDMLDMSFNFSEYCASDVADQEYN